MPGELRVGAAGAPLWLLLIVQSLEFVNRRFRPEPPCVACEGTQLQLASCRGELQALLSCPLEAAVEPVQAEPVGSDPHWNVSLLFSGIGVAGWVVKFFLYLCACCTRRHDVWVEDERREVVGRRRPAPRGGGLVV